MLHELMGAFAQVEGWMIALLPVALLTYFVPVLIAYARHHRYVWPIGALNFIIGWTVFGWLASLLWALNRDAREYAPPRSFHEQQPDLGSRPAAPTQHEEPRWNLDAAPPIPQPAVPAALPPRTEHRKCPACFQPVRPDALSCPSCGQQFRAAAAAARPGPYATATPVRHASPAPVVEHRRCPACTQPVRLDASMCPACGEDFRSPAAAVAAVRPVAPVRELDRREPRVFADARRESAEQSRADAPRPLKTGRLSGKPGTHGDDSDWLYVPGSGERRH